MHGIVQGEQVRCAPHVSNHRHVVEDIALIRKPQRGEASGNLHSLLFRRRLLLAVVRISYGPRASVLSVWQMLGMLRSLVSTLHVGV